jgi:copper transport protein
VKARALAVVAASAALAFPAGAGAHGLLVRAEPADGSRLSGASHSIQLWFNEKISTRFRSVSIVDTKGRTVPGVRARGDASTRLTIDVPRLGNGAYAINWRVLSEFDGHVTNGTLMFGVGPGAVPSGQGSVADSRPATADVAFRWLMFSFVAVMLGGLVFAAVVLPSARATLDLSLAGRAARRVLTAAVGAGTLAGVVAVLILDRQTMSLSSIQSRGYATTLVDVLTSTRWGALWLVHTGMLATLVLLSVWLRRRAPNVPVPAAVVAAVASVILVAAEALGSHAAALQGAPAAVVADATHVLSASVWLGIVTALAIAVWPARGLSRLDVTALAIALRRPFAFIAGGSIAVAAVTGLYAAGLQVASVDALLTTLYGRVMMTKAVLVLVAGAFGLTNAFLLTLLARGRLSPSRWLPRVLAVELAAGSAVLVTAGLLTSAAPAHGPAFAQPRPVRDATLAGQAQDVVVTLAVRPNRAGPNAFTVLAASSRRPAPAPIARVGLQLPNAPVVWLREVAPGRYLGLAALSNAGPNAATVVISRAGERLASRFAWRAEPPDPARPVTVSALPLSSLTNPAAVMLVLAAAAALACAAAIRGRRRFPPARRVAVARIQRRSS